MTELLKELRESIENIDHFVEEITNNSKASLVKSLSVELRKILSTGRGNNLLERVSNDLGIDIKLPIRRKKPLIPPSYIGASIEEYRNETLFSLRGRVVKRIDLIKIMADERGAHTDDEVDILHTQSKQIYLPLGNPKVNGIYEQNAMYLLAVFKTISKEIKDQLL